MDAPGTGDFVDAVIRFRSYSILFTWQASLEYFGFAGAEVVAAADHVAPMCVCLGIEAGEKREHFCSMAAAAEDDEEVGWGTARAWWRACAVEGWENVEESELESWSVELNQ